MSKPTLVPASGTTDHIGVEEDGENAFQGMLSDVWIAQEYIDFSVEANRRKFIKRAWFYVAFFLICFAIVSAWFFWS